jgi:methylenetetrahydrofolate reductase (NADPH)
MAEKASATPGHQADCEADLMIGGSLEMSPERASDAMAIAALLPSGTRVYVNHLPNHGLAQSLAALASVRAAGLEPVPHIAARRIGSLGELSEFLKQAVRDAGVSKVLLIGGDDPKPAGPFADAIQLLRDRILADSGVREVGLPGYPEGHPRIPQTALDQALTDKLELAQAQGLSASIVTQFSFAPARIVEYCSELARKVPEVPVYVGCGVSASLRAMGAQGMGAVRLFMHTEPSEQLSAVAQYCLRHADCNVLGAHLFSFGSAAKSAAWMNRVITARGAAG